MAPRLSPFSSTFAMTKARQQLWNKKGVRVWDEHKQQEIDLQALLFVTINDWPALSNLSGQTNKRYHACTHCLAEPKVYTWTNAGRMCTWAIVDFFRPTINVERKASI